MIWTAPSAPPAADGPLVGDDRPILEGFLAGPRSTLVATWAGLTGHGDLLRERIDGTTGT